MHNRILKLCAIVNPDYGKADKVIVDIITLDSESCAPCQYMVEAVKNVAPEFEKNCSCRHESGIVVNNSNKHVLLKC